MRIVVVTLVLLLAGCERDSALTRMSDYDLAERYGRAGGSAFSVETEVRRLFPRG